MIKLIAAVGPNGLIGKGDKMPWHISEEFKHFKETTMNGTLLMGRKTFEALPGKLPGRKMIVLSKGKVQGADESITIEGLKDLFDKYRDSEETLWIAGGKSIYESFYQEASELIISEVQTTNTGDVFLQLDLSNYSRKIIKNNKDFIVYSYKITNTHDRKPW